MVAPGCLDMVNFWAPDTIPEKFAGRSFYPHNPNVTLMRTNVEENRRLGEIMAAKLNLSVGPVTVLLPRKGLSMIDAPGEPFWWPEADEALFSALKQHLRTDIPVLELDNNINDPAFADEHPNGTHWKNADDKWCFVTFNHWIDERYVYVDRDDGGWRAYWWFAGVRK